MHSGCMEGGALTVDMILWTNLPCLRRDHLQHHHNWKQGALTPRRWLFFDDYHQALAENCMASSLSSSKKVEEAGAAVVKP